MAKTNIACAQIDCVLGDPKTNRTKIISSIRAAAERDAKLVLFPECALTGYSFDSLEEAIPFAEPLNGPSAQAIAEVCSETRVYAAIGFIETDGNKFHNAAMLVGPEGVVGGYRKVHMPFIGIDRFVTPGDRPFQVFELPFGKVGLNICYDISFPEAARVLKLLGAELVALITNWPPAAWRSPEFVVKARRLGFRLRERPVRHYPRPAGTPTGASPAVIARALREQIDWRQLRARTSGSPYAKAFFTLVEELGVAEPRADPRAERAPTSRVRVVDAYRG